MTKTLVEAWAKSQFSEEEEEEVDRKVDVQMKAQAIPTIPLEPHAEDMVSIKGIRIRYAHATTLNRDFPTHNVEGGVIHPLTCQERLLLVLDGLWH